MKNLFLALVLAFLSVTSVNAASVGIKVSNAVSSSASSEGSLVTAYTCPMDSFAILNFSLIATENRGRMAVYVQGKVFESAPSNVLGVTHTGVFVGPGQTVQVLSSGFGVSATVSVSGVELANTL